MEYIIIITVAIGTSCMWAYVINPYLDRRERNKNLKELQDQIKKTANWHNKMLLALDKKEGK